MALMQQPWQEVRLRCRAFPATAEYLLEGIEGSAVLIYMNSSNGPPPKKKYQKSTLLTTVTDREGRQGAAGREMQRKIWQGTKEAPAGPAWNSRPVGGEQVRLVKGPGNTREDGNCKWHKSSARRSTTGNRYRQGDRMLQSVVCIISGGNGYPGDITDMKYFCLGGAGEELLETAPVNCSTFGI